jgi:hypothetical protein
LDGQERLVDYLGRTEEEAAEENAVDPHSLFIMPPEEEEEDVVEHPGIKPMWLLRFFTSWGARWGAAAPSGGQDDKKRTEKAKSPDITDTDDNGSGNKPYDNGRGNPLIHPSQ